MAKAKTPNNPASPAAAKEQDEAETPSGIVLSSDDQALLERVLKLLTHVNRVPYAAVAHREGYTAKEHKEGWRLFKLASGENRPLEHLFEESTIGTTATQAAERLRLLQDVDAFENAWFPRTRAIIRRVVPAAHRDAFETAFFKNLEQQPLGPAVIGSVSTFLGRLDALAKSDDDNAKKLRTVLVERGLTDAKLHDIRALLNKLEGTGGKKTGKVSTAELAKSQTEQLDALVDLRGWYNDWATTFRQVFNTRAQINLGLTTQKRPTRETGEDDADSEDNGDEAKPENG